MRHWQALCLDLRLDQRPAASACSLAPLGVHLLGLLAIVRITHHPLWLVLALVLAVEPLVVSSRLRRWYWMPEALTPMGIAYGVLAARVVVALVARWQGLTAAHLTVPQPWNVWLDLDAVTALSGAWTLLAQAGPLSEALGKVPGQIGWRELARRHVGALAFEVRLSGAAVPARHSLLLLTLHLWATGAISRFTHQRPWPALVAVLMVQPLLVSLRLGRWQLLPESLAPLLLAYGALMLRLPGLLQAGAQPLGGLLNPDVAALLAGLWALLAQARATAQAWGKEPDWKSALGLGLGALGLGWSAVTFLSLRTHGVTGSDPYAYVQMAVDLARYGTPLHRFGLAPQVAQWGLPVEAAVPVGYRPLDPQSGLAATVWPPGHAALLAVAYLVGGESGLYLLTPLLGLAALAATGWLCLEALQGWQGPERILAAGVALLVLATSYGQVDRLLVPMADGAAQLFTVLTVTIALRARRARHKALWASLSGLCLGSAFSIRYTQLLVALAVLAAWLSPSTRQKYRWRETALTAGCFGAAAWVAASPVLWYHQVAFGNPFRVGSYEMERFGLRHFPDTVLRTVNALCSPTEFLYLLPFLGWGSVRLARRSRREARVLLTCLAAVGLFHLFYGSLRLRDLLSLFPILSLWVGAGVADAFSRTARLRRQVWQTTGRMVGFALLAGVLWARGADTLRLPVPPMHFNTFGYLLPGQRAAFDQLARLVPAQAVIAASLNSGPVELYAHRRPVRPEEWSAQQWLDFVEAAQSQGMPVYLLVDGVDMEGPTRTVGQEYRLRLVSHLPLPYFYVGGGSENRQVSLYQVLAPRRAD